MRVVICHTDFRVYWPARLRALREYCSKHGAELAVIEIAGHGSPYAFAGGRPESDEWWRCLFPEQRMEDLRPAQCATAVFEALDNADPDVVIAGAIAFPSGAAAVRWARRRNHRVVIMDDARLADVPRGRLVNWVKRRIYSNVDAMFLPAPSHVPDYEFWGIPKARMFFGLNVVDNDYFVTKAAAFRAHAEEWRPRLRAPQRYVLGVGRQIPKKNWHGLLEAWRRFKQMRPKSDLELVLVGNGPERQALVSKAETAGKSKDVHFHDFASQEVMPAYYALAEALILPSHGETWGLVVNEAMACGLPILVSLECGCAATLVVPGENGWTFPANETQALMQVLLALEDTPSAALERMGQKSWAIINEWGLQRFCAGAWDAVQSARAGRVLPISLLDLLVFKAWDGRYRPV